MKNILIAALLLLLIFLQYQLWFTPGGVSKTIQLHHLIAKQDAKNSAVDEKNAALVNGIRDLRQNSSAVESEARSKLGMIKHGETFYRVVGGGAENN